MRLLPHLQTERCQNQAGGPALSQNGNARLKSQPYHPRELASFVTTTLMSNSKNSSAFIFQFHFTKGDFWPNFTSISGPTSPPINHVGNLWIAVLTDPRAIEAANLGPIFVKKNDKSIGETKVQKFRYMFFFKKGFRERNQWFPPKEKLTNVP